MNAVLAVKSQIWMKLKTWYMKTGNHQRSCIICSIYMKCLGTGKFIAKSSKGLVSETDGKEETEESKSLMVWGFFLEEIKVFSADDGYTILWIF